MNKFLIFLFLISSFSALAGSQEEQRKYIFDNIDSRLSTFVKEGKLKGLKVLGHSVYNYYDLYLDTDERDLFNKNLSLRLRKRFFADGSIAYGIQLKSEMLNNGDVRMEVEEDELKFFKIFHNNVIYSMTNIMTEMFDYFEQKTSDNENVHFQSDAYMQERVDIISTWTHFKIKSSIAPFQKLIRSGINLEKLKTLKPVMIGKSIRSRSHIYIDRSDTNQELKTFNQSLRSQLETPDLVRGTDKIWTMESSLDRARFYPLQIQKNFHEINEYEIENKYLPLIGVERLFKQFETGLIETYGAQINLDSKFRQSMLNFLE
jgi:hypothetical protein